MDIQAPEQTEPNPTAAAAAAPPDVEQVLGLEGLSEAEKNALLAEQAKIMASIERSKQSSPPKDSANSAADAFEQRSFQAAVTAIGSGGGGEGAGGGTVTLSDGTTVTLDDDQQQLDADRAMAEQLQKEEYQNAQRQERRHQRQQQQQTQPQQSQDGQSWSEWLGLSSAGSGGVAGTGPGSPSAVRPPPQPTQRPLQRGEMGVSRPPGAAGGSGNLSSPSSYDEDDALLRGGGGGGAARVAQKQANPFSCVTDSISQAVTQAATALNTQLLNEDSEGNVHGVDASSLLNGGGGGGGGAGGTSQQTYDRLPDRE